MKNSKSIIVLMHLAIFSSVFGIEDFDFNDTSFDNVMKYGGYATNQVENNHQACIAKKSIRFNDSIEKLESTTHKRIQSVVDDSSSTRKSARIGNDKYRNSQVNVYVKKEPVQLHSILKSHESFSASKGVEAVKKEQDKDVYIKSLIRTYSTKPQLLFDRTVGDVIYYQATLQCMKSQACQIPHFRNMNCSPTQAEINNVVQPFFMQAKKEIYEDSLRNKNNEQETLFDQSKRKNLKDISNRYFKNLIVSYESQTIYNGMPANSDVYAAQDSQGLYSIQTQFDNHVMKVDVGVNDYGKSHAVLLEQSAVQNKLAMSSSNSQSSCSRTLSVFPDIYKRIDMNAEIVIDLKNNIKKEAYRIINSK